MVLAGVVMAALWMPQAALLIPQEVPPEPSLSQPEWLRTDESLLEETRAARLVVSAPSESACAEALEREILVAINKQIVLCTERNNLPERLAKQVLAEPSDRALVNLDDQFMEKTSQADQPGGERIRCWGLIHFTPAFYHAIQQRVSGVQRSDRLRTVGLVTGSTILALCTSFGYLQGLRRLPAGLAVGGIVGLAMAWCAAALALLRILF
jgi:hypothetical protein